MTERTIKPSLLFAIYKASSILFINIFSVAAIYFYPQYNRYALIPVCLSLVIFIYRVLLISSYAYIIGDEQLILKRGVFTLKQDYLELYRVKDYNVVKNIVYRIMGVMLIKIETSDKSHPTLLLDGVKNSDIIDELRQLVEINRRARGVREFD